MSRLERYAGQRILQEVKTLGAQYPYIAGSVDWLRNNTSETLARENTFTKVIQEINTSQNDSGVYRDVNKLKSLIGNKPLPTLGQIVIKCDHLAQDTLKEATAEYPQWADKEFPSYGTPVWSMIIEGYGKYLGKKYALEDKVKRDDISKTFVRAFEAIAFTNHRESALTEDIMYWMHEEKEDFPPEIADQL